jgi:hypothetical protein
MKPESGSSSLCRRLTPTPVGLFVLFFALASLLHAQNGVFVLSSGFALPGGSISLNLTYKSEGSVSPAAVQWTLAFDPASITAISVTTGPAAVTSAKSITCSAANAAYACLLWGANANGIPNGIVATVNVTVAPSVSGPVPLALENLQEASPDGGALAAAGFGGTIIVINGGPGAATQLSITAPADATAGLPVLFTVTALDSGNHAVTAYSDPVHFSSTDALAALPRDLILTNGMGTFPASLVTPGIQMLTATDLFAPSISGTSGSILVSPSVSGSGFLPVTPCRVADTRNATSLSGFGPPWISGGAGGIRSFSIPDGPCGIPSTAQAYSLNVAVFPHGQLGYLTLWPSGQSQPLVTTLNSPDGRVKSTAAIIPAGNGGAIDVFATDDTDIVLDINGYFVPASTASALAFYPVSPCRLVDTRLQLLSGGPLGAGTNTTLPILSSACNVPPSAQAYSLNFTTVAPGQVQSLAAYPTGGSQPALPTLIALPPTPIPPVVIANAGIIPAGTGGSIDVSTSNTTDLVVDIDGYFAPPGTGGLSLYTLPPCRVLDTRQSPQLSLSPAVPAIDIDVTASGCGGTNAAQAYLFSVTALPAGPLPYLTLWPGPAGTSPPVVATLTALDGVIANNMAIALANPATNQMSAFGAAATADLILDIFGYFAP